MVTKIAMKAQLINIPVLFGSALWLARELHKH